MYLSRSLESNPLAFICDTYSGVTPVALSEVASFSDMLLKPRSLDPLINLAVTPRDFNEVSSLGDISLKPIELNLE